MNSRSWTFPTHWPVHRCILRHMLVMVNMMMTSSGVASALVFQGSLQEDGVSRLVESITNRTADVHQLDIGDVTVTYEIQQCLTSIGWLWRCDYYWYHYDIIIIIIIFIVWTDDKTLKKLPSYYHRIFLLCVVILYNNLPRSCHEL